MGKNSLFRDPRQGKIAGVCAGIGEYFNIEVWWVRIFAVSLFLLGLGFVSLLVYVALWLMLEKKPVEAMAQEPNPQAHNLKQKPWQAGQNPQELLDTLDADFTDIDAKIQKMEAYVTSDEYKLRREFNKL
ncbi:MAG: envelope stress response membrane protein PspC [Vibrio sp.]